MFDEECDFEKSRKKAHFGTILGRNMNIYKTSYNN